MVLERYRARLAPYMDRWVRPWLGWSPAALSWLGFGLLVGAGVLALLVRYTTPYLFLLVAVLVFAGGAFDVLDGEVARRTGRTSIRGDFLDHVLDRYGDVVVVLGIAASGFTISWLALLGLVSLLLASYMGTQAQAVGVGRLYRGLLSRADRLLLLSAFAFLEFLFVLPPLIPGFSLARFPIAGVSLTVFDLLFVYFVVAGQWTVVSRARQVWAALPPTRPIPPPPPPVLAPPPRP
jgi:archaetidylinositol phosphate synthase